MPQSFITILLILIFIVPGYIIKKVQELFVTFEKLSRFEITIECIIYSCLNYALWTPYLLYLYGLSQTNIFSQNLKVFLPLILMVFISPVVLGIITGYVTQQQYFYKFLCRIFKKSGISIKTPGTEIWDKAFDRPVKFWVRIHLSNDKIYEGLAEQISTYPFQKQLYLTNVGVVNEKGEKERELDTVSGVYIKADNVEVIEILE